MAAIGASILGVVFLVAAVGKALDPVVFAEQIRYEGLEIVLSAGLIAWIVVVLEAALGASLLLGLRTRSVLAVTGGLVVVFVFLTSRAYWRWLTGAELAGPDCGCFGNLVSRTAAEAFWQDLLLLVPGYAASWLDVVGARDRGARRRWWAVAGLSAAAGIFTALSPALPIDDLATKLGPGRQIAELCAGAGGRDGAESACLDLVVPELLEDRHLVVIASLDSSELAAAVPALNALASADRGRLWVLSDAPEEQIQTFFWEHGPRFEMREVPTALLRPLYRSLPRTFTVVDGTVTDTSQGLPGVVEDLPEYDDRTGGRGHE
jgi:uncharacterized membrane protein YphA (DoxX/SURF4 family)